MKNSSPRSVGLFSLLLLASAWLSAKTLDGQVTRVIDGDTITFMTQKGVELRIRLADIDAPELNQPWGKVAKNTLNTWALGERGYITIVDTDRYKRKVGYLFVDDANLNQRLVANGLAWVYVEYLRDTSLINTQEHAKKLNKGLWSSSNPVNPSKWRSNRRITQLQSTPKRISKGHVKKSRSGICHAPGTTYYSRTLIFQKYESIETCLSSGGRLPKG